MISARVHLTCCIASAAFFLFIVAMQNVCFADDKPDMTGPVQVGQEAPEVGGNTSDGNAVLKEHYDGHFVVAVYWSFDDPAWKQLHAKVLELRKRLEDRENFLIYTVCMDRQKVEDWFKWVGDPANQVEFKGHKVPLYNARPMSSAHIMDWPTDKRMVNLKRLPVIHLISPNNQFLAINVPVNELGKTVEKHLNAKPKPLEYLPQRRTEGEVNAKGK